VTYTPDASGSYLYSGNSTSGVITNEGAKITPTLLLTSPSPNITTADALPITVTMTLNGYIGNPVPTGTVVLTSGSYTSPTISLSNGGAIITVPAGSLPVGTDTLSASYTGDTTYTGVTGTITMNVTMPAGANFGVTALSLSLAKGATSGNYSTVTVTPTNGFVGAVTLTAAITSSPAGAQNLPSLSFGTTSPVSLQGPSSATALLTVSTTSATSAALRYPARPGPAERPGVPWYSVSGAGLACLLFFLTPAKRRRWVNLFGVIALLVLLSAGVTACGGGASNGGGGGSGNPGTTSGQYVVTVTGTSGATTASSSLTITVQ
jgi:hypothetical protein